MEISFKNRRLERNFSSTERLRRAYGERAEALSRRIGVLKYAATLAMVPVTRPERLHQLEGRRRGQFTVDIVHPYRLIFEPNHNPIPRKCDGGIDLTQVISITIIEVVDYHRMR